MHRLTLAISLFVIFSLAPQVRGLVIETRDNKPAFLSQSNEALQDKYRKHAKDGSMLRPPLRNRFYEYNDEIWFNDKFGKTSEWLSKYLPGEPDPATMISHKINPFEGLHPYYKAGRLPGIENNMVSSAYIALQSPLRYGKGSKTLYWDILWDNIKTTGVLVSLLEPDSRNALEKDEELIPTSKEEPLIFYEIDEDTGDLTCKDKYTLYLEKTESHHDGMILHHRLRLAKGGRSKTLDFFHYTRWKTWNAIDATSMTQLIEIVDTKKPGNNPIFVNCLLGYGRTGTFIMAREIYNTARKYNEAGKDWFQQKGVKGADPIENYLKTLRLVRHEMIDSARQFVFLYAWATHVWQELYGE